MRLTKTLCIVETKKSDTPIGYDDFGRPVYGNVTTKTPFLGEIEPYSNQLAQTKYGVIVDVTNRVFCEPNESIKLGSDIEYNEQSYEVTQCMEYDKHFEVLIKKVT